MSSIFDQAKTVLKNLQKQASSVATSELNTPLAKNIGKAISQQPLFSNPISKPFSINLPQQAPQKPLGGFTVGNTAIPFIQNKVITPAVKTASNLPYVLPQTANVMHALNPSHPNQVESMKQFVPNALQTVGNVATPLFSLGYAGYEGGKGAVNNFRLGKDIAEGFRQGVGGNAPSLGETFGQKGVPALALNATEFLGPLVHGNIKNISESIPALKLKGVSPNAFKIHPDDQAILTDVIGRLNAKQKLYPGDLKDLQNMAEHYLGEKFRTASTKKIANMFDYVLAAQNGGVKGKMPKMGVVADDVNAGLGDAPGYTAQNINQAKVGQGQVKGGLGLIGEDTSQTGKLAPTAEEQSPLRSITPEANQAGSQVPETVNPSTGSIPQQTQDYIKQMQKQQQNAATVSKGGLLSQGRNFLMDVKRKLVDSTAPIEDVLGEAQKKGKYQVLPTKDISPQIDRAIRSRELGGQFLKDNGMVDVIRNAPDINALDQYLIAKHAPEVATETGRNPQADAQLVQDLSATYEPYAQKVVAYGQKLLDYAAESGLVSKDVATALKQKYPNYVPLNRIFNELEQVKPPEGVGARGPASISGQNVVQTLKGSTRAISNPIESLLTKTVDAFAQGERNQAGQMLASYKDLPGNPFQLRELKPGESAQHTVSYLEGGVKKTFETTPEVAQAAKFLDKRQLGFIGQIFATPVRLARIGITGVNIPFIAANIAKDQVTATINSNHALSTSMANPGVFLKSLWNAVGHGKEYDEWIRSAGGGTSFDISRSEPNVSVAQIRAGKNIASNIGYTVTHPSQLLRAVENIVNRGEELTRLQQFSGTKQALLKQGRTAKDAEILAAKASRENTVNFGRSGDWGKALNSVFLYMNAGIQGSRTLLRSLEQHPVATSSKIGLTVFTPLAAVTAWNMSDPKRLAAYNDIRDYEKENNMVIIPPNPTKDPKTGKWNVIKIPFSQEVANLTIPVRKGIEAMHGSAGPTFMDVAAGLLGTATSLNTQTPNALVGQFIPQAIKPELEATLNKNLFSGTDIVPQYLPGGASKDLPPDQQVYPDTSGTARGIGKVLNTSPLKVEQFIKSSAGGVGSQLLNASDTALNKVGLIPKEQIGGQSVPEGIAQRFSQATGGQDLTKLASTKERNANSNIVENKGKFYVATGNGTLHSYPTKQQALSSAPIIMSELNQAGTREEKIQLWNKMVQDKRITKQNVSDIKLGITDQKLKITDEERSMRSQGVVSGERAQSIASQFKKLKTSEEKKALWNRYVQSKIITKEVATQLYPLLK